jgi:hypothetical protein
MAEQVNIEDLIADVDVVVADGLAYFAGVDYGSRPEVEWVLRHMLFWHRASAEGMESVLAGGSPFRIAGTVDEMNDRAAADTAGLTTTEIVDALRDLQARMVAAVRKLDDPETTVVVLHDGTERPASQRLRMTAFHWKGHLEELGA